MSTEEQLQKIKKEISASKNQIKILEKKIEILQTKEIKLQLKVDNKKQAICQFAGCHEFDPNKKNNCKLISSHTNSIKTTYKEMESACSWGFPDGKTRNPGDQPPKLLKNVDENQRKEISRENIIYRLKLTIGLLKGKKPRDFTNRCPQSTYTVAKLVIKKYLNINANVTQVKAMPNKKDLIIQLQNELDKL